MIDKLNEQHAMMVFHLLTQITSPSINHRMCTNPPSKKRKNTTATTTTTTKGKPASLSLSLSLERQGSCGIINVQLCELTMLKHY